MEIITAASRYLLPFITIVLLSKCIMALLLGHPKEKIYGYIVDTSAGDKFALNMWETSIGRSNSCDIVVGYNTVSRSHAVISRRIDGWYIYDLNSMVGTKVNGVRCDGSTTIKNGDVISLGNIPFRFEIINDPVQRVGKKKKKGNKSRSAAPVRKENTAPVKKVPPKAYEPVPEFRNERDFYDDYNKPSLDFEKPSYTIETPKKSKNITASQPRLINKDTNEVFILCGNEVSIGSGTKCDIRLRSREVARLHALIVLYEDGWAIENASPQNITHLNKTRVTSPLLLFDGDVISMGDERLYYKTNR